MGHHRAQPVSQHHPNRAGLAEYGRSRQLGDVEFLRAHFRSHRFAPHTHPVFAVGAVRRGACRIWHRGTSHVAGPGDLVLIAPGTPHSADPAAGDVWDYCALYFSTATARLWCGRLPATPVFRSVVAGDIDLSTRLERLCVLLADDPDQSRAEAPFARFVRHLFSRFGEESPRDAALDCDDAPAAARRYLDAHFAEPVRIEHLADHTGRNPYGLIRAFSREFGMPPYTYLTHVRVSRAQEMLRTGRPISDTAFSVGFSDQSHLTRFFRRIVGVPPGVWVRGVGRSEAADASAKAAATAGMLT